MAGFVSWRFRCASLGAISSVKLTLKLSEHKNSYMRTFSCRNQTMQLFQKFHAAKIFEDVRGTKHNNEMFADNGRLFR